MDSRISNLFVPERRRWHRRRSRCQDGQGKIETVVDDGNGLVSEVKPGKRAKAKEGQARRKGADGQDASWIG
jgi:hypothetical protein